MNQSIEELVSERERLDSLIALRTLEQKHEKAMGYVRPSSRDAVSEIRRVMRERGTTLQEVADKCGVKRQSVHQTLSGHRQAAKKIGKPIGITMETIYRYAAALDQDVVIKLVPKGGDGA